MSDQMTTFSAVLGALLYLRRRDSGIDQSEMARRMGLSQASYSRLEGGKSTFSIDQIFQAADALRIDNKTLLDSLSQRVEDLRSEGVLVVTHQRASTKGASESKSDLGTFIAGAALGALVASIISS